MTPEDSKLLDTFITTHPYNFFISSEIHPDLSEYAKNHVTVMPESDFDNMNQEYKEKKLMYYISHKSLPTILMIEKAVLLERKYFDIM